MTLHCCYNMEISLNVKSKLFVQFSCDGLWFDFINVGHLPFLAHLVISGPHDYILIFSVFPSRDVQHFSFFVDYIVSLVSEQLEPSGVGFPHSSITGCSRILNVDRSLWESYWYECFGRSIKHKLLSLRIFSWRNDKIIIDYFNKSSHPQSWNNVEGSIPIKSKIYV